ncbi:hypothetical protein, partial [Comamonas sp.]|uniref:hypothetical protein n=1 Tax=Comamonas sp. TaxID=34028 RepID=UPI0025BF4089
GYVVFLGAHCAYGQAGLRRRLIVRLHKILHTLWFHQKSRRCLSKSTFPSSIAVIRSVRLLVQPFSAAIFLAFLIVDESAAISAWRMDRCVLCALGPWA